MRVDHTVHTLLTAIDKVLRFFGTFKFRRYHYGMTGLSHLGGR